MRTLAARLVQVGVLRTVSTQWLPFTDLLVVLMAIALPWSTTAVGVLTAAWLLALVPFIPAVDWRAAPRMLPAKK